MIKDATPDLPSTDIVERLRMTGDPWPQYADVPLCVEAAAEIERLRHENMRLLTANEYAFAPVGELSKLNREIERLTVALGPTAAEAWAHMYDETVRLHAEIERLQNGNRPLPFNRDELGRMVREAWVRWALTHPNPKASWLLPYDKLPEPDKEADRQIGEAIARFTLIGDAARRALEPKPSRHQPPGYPAHAVGPE